MGIKLSGVPVWDGGDIPAGSYIPTAIKIGATEFTLRKVNPNQIGATGPAGAAGATILNGAGAPAVGVGSNGDYFLNTLTGDFYTKVGGVWNLLVNLKGPAGAAGAAGADGADGAAGADGATWYTAAGAPGAGTGVDGDFYLNSTNGDYYLKVAGAWVLQGSLKGATGATGPAGGSEYVSNDGAALDLMESYSDGAITTFDEGIGWGDTGKGTNATVVSNTHENGATHRAVQLSRSGGEFARGLFVGEDWARLDVLITLRLNGPASNMSTASGNNFYFGLCSGLTNTLEDASTDNFIGLGMQNQTWNYVAGTKWSHYTGTYAYRAYTRRGASYTDQGGGSGSSGRHYAQEEGHVTAIGFSILQAVVATPATARNFTMYVKETSNSEEEFVCPDRVAHGSNIARHDVAATSANIEWCGGSSQNFTVNFDESTGVFDTFVLYWENVDSCDFELYGISIAKRFY